MRFPLSGLARDLHPLANAHAERTAKKNFFPFHGKSFSSVGRKRRDRGCKENLVPMARSGSFMVHQKGYFFFLIKGKPEKCIKMMFCAVFCVLKPIYFWGVFVLLKWRWVYDFGGSVRQGRNFERQGRFFVYQKRENCTQKCRKWQFFEGKKAKSQRNDSLAIYLMYWFLIHCKKTLYFCVFVFVG